MQTISAICVISFVLATVTFQEGSAISCWRCSSDSRGGEFCSDPFNVTAADSVAWAKFNCKEPKESYKVAVCKKTVQNINGKVVVKRSCSSEDVEEEQQDCIAPSNSPSFVKTVDCRTCRTDRCNGDIDTDYNSLTKDFPPGELNRFTTKPDLDNDDDENEDDEDNEGGDNILGDITHRANLVTKPDTPTEEVFHADDPELNVDNSADVKSVYGVVSLLVAALFAKLVSA